VEHVGATNHRCVAWSLSRENQSVRAGAHDLIASIRKDAAHEGRQIGKPAVRDQGRNERLHGRAILWTGR